MVGDHKETVSSKHRTDTRELRQWQHAQDLHSFKPDNLQHGDGEVGTKLQS